MVPEVGTTDSHPWAVFTHDGGGEQATSHNPDANGICTIPFPAGDRIASLCQLCSLFFNEWQADGFRAWFGQKPKPSVPEPVRSKSMPWFCASLPCGQRSRAPKVKVHVRPRWTSTYDQYITFEHHGNLSSLVASAIRGCDLCQVFLFAVVNTKDLWGQSSALDIGPHTRLSPNASLRIDPTKTPKGLESFRLKAESGGFVLLVIAPSVKKHSYEFTSKLVCTAIWLDMTVQGPWALGQHRASPFHLTLPPRVSISAIAASARSMLRYCQQNHTACARPVSGFPTLRVIDVGTVRDRTLRLVDTKTLAREPYISLSYCWGEGNVFQLKLENLEACYQSLPFESLPSTLRDAIELTRLLEIRYIWIDALCIVQDDPKEWESEALRMGQLYESAELCISALRAPSSTSGLFPNGTVWEGMKVKIGDQDGRDFTLQPRYYKQSPALHGALQESRMASRGWIMQERVLSCRILHVGQDETFFECRHGIMGETGRLRIESMRDISPLTLDNLREILDNSSLDHKMYSWYLLVHEYAKRDFTNEIDRLPAFDGIRQIFQSAIGSYSFYGLWETDIYHGLLWFKSSMSELLRDRQLDTIGASYHNCHTTMDQSLQLERIVFGNPQLIPKKCERALSLQLGQRATWSWASALPSVITFVLQDNGFSDPEHIGLTWYSHPRAPSKIPFVVLETGHREIGGIVRPSLRLDGPVIPVRVDYENGNTMSIEIQGQSIEFSLLPEITFYTGFEKHDRSYKFYPDREPDGRSLSCYALVACESETPYETEQDEWAITYTLTLLLLKSVTLAPGELPAHGAKPSRVFERLGVAFLKADLIPEFLRRHIRANGKEDFYLV